MPPGRRRASPAELERNRLEENAEAAQAAFMALRALWGRPHATDANAFVTTLLAPLVAEFGLVTRPGSTFAHVSGFGAVDPGFSRTIFLNPAAPGRVDFDGHTYVLAHLMAHLGLGHYRAGGHPPTRAAQEIVADTFVRSLGLSQPPETYTMADRDGDDVDRLALAFRRGEPYSRMTMAGPDAMDYFSTFEERDYESRLAEGLEALVALRAQTLRPNATRSGVAEEARRQIMNRYPLLAAMAQRVRLITDRAAVSREGIEIAAVNPRLGEIYLSVDANLSVREAVFVLAHELLHLGLRHGERVGGRDPVIWNMATDLVINGWLVAMAVGVMPQRGLLYDPAVAGKSADEIYDLLATIPARRRKMKSFRGANLGDMILSGQRTVVRGDVTTLDDLYANALRYGLDAHRLRYGAGRGTVPADLEEEINALDMEPVPWDVALARWFEEFVPSLEPVRTYARSSRRQAATPDIPRPRYWLPEALVQSATFGVILDTSGSMDRETLAKALGAIAAYADERGVRYLRLVYCDAMPYDEGYISPDTLRRATAVKGRGGTALAPAAALLEASRDFPVDAPLLVLTDGLFETELALARTHAWVLPIADAYTPFRSDGAPVFRVL